MSFPVTDFIGMSGLLLNSALKATDIADYEPFGGRNVVSALSPSESTCGATPVTLATYSQAFGGSANPSTRVDFRRRHALRHRPGRQLLRPRRTPSSTNGSSPVPTSATGRTPLGPPLPPAPSPSTLLETMHVPAIPGADGVSLLPLLRQEPFAPLRLYAETGYTHATPDVFDPGHFSGGARGFDAYRIRPDGIVEMNDAAHAVAMGEKDIGAFDGQGWLIRSPRADGSIAAVCRGHCSPELSEWLDAVHGTGR